MTEEFPQEETAATVIHNAHFFFPMMLWIYKSNLFQLSVYTLYIVFDGTPISTFCFKGNLSENHLSYMDKWYLIF